MRRSPRGLLDDPLGTVLGSLRLAGALYYRSDVGGDWGVAVPASTAAHFHALDAGRATVHVPGEVDLVLEPGDLIVLPRGHAHTLASSSDARCTSLSRVLELTAARGWRLELGPAPRARMLCGYVDIGAGATHPLVGAMPALLRVRKDPTCADLVAAISREASAPRAGATAMIARLCEALVCQVVRVWYEREGARASWLAALADRQLSAALVAMHRRIAHPWTVAELARTAALSRPAFARRFAARIGDSPLSYLARARMFAAADLLRASDMTLDAIAAAVGYRSVEAFARSFRRAFGTPPATYRKTGGAKQLGRLFEA